MKILDLQQGSAEWKNVRKGVITGSGLKNIMGKTAKAFMYKLIAQQISPLPFQYTSEAMEHGVLFEDEAIDKYEKEMGILTEKVGFCLHSERSWHGISPDRFVKKEKHYIGAVEAKCPIATTQIKYIDQDKIPSDYKWQIVNYFLVNEKLQWLDFWSYCPDIEVKELQTFYKRVTRKELKKDIEMAEKKLLEFRKKWHELEIKLTF